MPNEHGQVLPSDYIAPVGFIRVIAESMDDGEIQIAGDFVNFEWFKRFMENMAWNDEWVFIVCGPEGMISKLGEAENVTLGEVRNEKDKYWAPAGTLHVLAGEKDESIALFYHPTWLERFRRTLKADDEKITGYDEDTAPW